MARNDAVAENHHVVPKNTLLGNFSVDGIPSVSGKVHLYDKEKGCLIPGPTSVKNVLAHRNFYSVKLGSEKLTIEQGLADLEDAASPIIKKIMKTSSLSHISNDDRLTLATFIAAQHLRSPRVRDSQQILANAIAEKAKIIAPDASNLNEFQFNTHEDVVKVRSMKLIADAGGNIAESLFSYRWSLNRAPEESNFWISDCPVVMHNEEDYKQFGKYGFEVPGIQIGMPLSPKLLLSIYHPKVINDIKLRSLELVGLLQKLKAKFLISVGSGWNALKREIQDTEVKLAYIENFVSSLDHGEALKSTAENVVHFNALQHDWALRFIVSSTPNFELARNIRADNPNAGIVYRVG
jgi:Protein of unknown function (DUF4238)